MVTSGWMRSVWTSYINGYVPKLQVSGQVAWFMTRHLGYPIPSPAIMEKIGTRFRRVVNVFATAHQIPGVQIKRTTVSRT